MKDWIRQLSNEIYEKYQSTFVKVPRSLQDLRDGTDSWYGEITARLKCEKSGLDIKVFHWNKVYKAVLGEWLEDVTDLLELERFSRSA